MITATLAFQQALAESSKTPVYGFAFTGGSAEFRICNVRPRLNPGLFVDASETFMPLSMERSADPRESRFTVSSFQFLWYDHDGQATQLVSGIIGNVGTFYMSFWELDWDTDKITLFQGIISDVSLTQGGYTVTVRSAITLLMDKQIYSPAGSTLISSMDDSQTNCVIGSAEAFGQSGDILFGADGGERVTYLGKTDNGNGTWTLTGLVRGNLFTTASAHAAGTRVREIFVVASQHPMDILSDMLTGTNPKRDLNMSAWTDTAALDDLQAELGSLLMQFNLTEGGNAKEWIEKEFMRPLAIYPIEDNEGKISAKTFGQPEQADFVGAISDASLLNFARWSGRYDREINKVFWKHSWNFDTNAFEGSGEQSSDGLIAARGKIQGYTINSKGIGFDDLSAAIDIMEQRSQAYFSRFGSAPGLIEAESILANILLEMGDSILATFQEVVSLPESERSVSDFPVEIIGMRTDFRTNKIQFIFLSYSTIEFSFEALAEASEIGESATDVTVLVA